ncbi:MAG: hypothetical protein LBQ81_03410, partial [Zoogloeaceae bacterium]|nr:hypothetical protein [Zoogloeaceae bacterium]
MVNYIFLDNEIPCGEWAAVYSFPVRLRCQSARKTGQSHTQMSSAFEETRWQSAVDEVAVSFAALHAKKSNAST